MGLKMKCKIVEEWDDMISAFSAEKKDIYFTKKYLTLYETPKNKALCVVCTDGDKIMLMPYLRGEINRHYDFETVYEYGGPIFNVDDFQWCRNAFNEAYDFLKENNYICGFIRFHPLIKNQRFLQGKDDFGQELRNIQILYDRPTIVIDTDQSVENIWMMQISSKNRNMIRKAEKNQLEYKAEYDYASYDEFIAFVSWNRQKRWETDLCSCFYVL